jgi:hypothetical protein
MKFNVAGISFQVERNEGLRLLRPAGSVEFEPEPDNQYDPDAVKVMYKGMMLGYVPKGYVQDLCVAGADAVIDEYCYKGDTERFPPKGFNQEHDGVLGSVTVRLVLQEEEPAGNVIGGRYLRVTTFLKYFDMYGGGDGLFKWLVNQAFERKESFSSADELIEEAMLARDETAQAGTDMHDAIEHWFRTGEDNGKLPEGWFNFVNKYAPEPISMEERFKDNEIMVTGRYDFLGYVDMPKMGRVKAVLDWKSNKKATESNRMQAGIYAKNLGAEAAGVVSFGSETKQKFSFASLNKAQINDYYTAARHIKAAMDVIGLWIPEHKYFKGEE